MSLDTAPSVNETMQAELGSAFDSALAAETPPEPAAVTFTPPPVEAAPAPVPEPVSEPDAIAASAPAPSTATSIADDTEVEVLVNGEPVKMSWGDARKAVMMHSAFTQKTQALAKDREEVARLRAEGEQWRTASQTEIQRARQRESDIMAMVKDPNKLAALYLAATGQALPEGTANPLAPPPAAAPPAFDPAQIREQLFADLAPRVQDYIGRQQYQAAQAADVTTFTEALVSDAPILKALGPDYLESVYAKVHTTMQALGENSPAQAKEYIRLEIDATKKAIAEATGNTAKAAAVAKAQAVNATERGGSVVPPTKVEPKNSKEIHAQILEWLDTQPSA